MTVSGLFVIVFDMELNDKLPKVVVLGGGTGSHMILTGLRHFPLDLQAIVSMADDGGSTGVLRTELGILPPGDLRQALIALSDLDGFMINLLNHRFVGPVAGNIPGHSLGNMIIGAAEQVSIEEGLSYKDALDHLHKFFRVKGRVWPVSFDSLVLHAESMTGQEYEGQHVINTDKDLLSQKIKRVYYKNDPTANLHAIEAILNADLIVLSPGNVFCSLLPILTISGIAKALKNTKAKVLMVSNLMTKFGHTDNFSTYDFFKLYENVVGASFVDFLLYNNSIPDKEMITRYEKEGELVVHKPEEFKDVKDVEVIGADILSGASIPKLNSEDLTKFKVPRTLIRHNSQKVASEIFNILDRVI